MPIIINASAIFAPPRQNTDGCSGDSSRAESTEYSRSNSLPMATGSKPAKPISVGCARCAAANASHTNRSPSGASFATTWVRCIAGTSRFSLRSNRVISSAMNRTLSSSRISPSRRDRIAALAAGPHTSSTKRTSRPSRPRSTPPCRSSEAKFSYSISLP